MTESTDVRFGVRATVPCRACLSGEDLDWLGGRSVSVALGLPTVVTTVPGPPPPPTGDWADQVWDFLRTRLTGLPPRPPATEVTSEAPSASGLSSSTALIVGLFRAYTDAGVPASDPVPVATLAQWAYEFEFRHFNGGGMDHLAVIEGGALLLEGRPTGLPAVVERAGFPADWAVLVLDSASRKDTSDHIRTVRAQLRDGDPALAAYLKEADTASADAWSAIGSGELGALAEAMDRAHTAMRDHQRMSTPLLEALRAAALRSTGLTLKLSGAGGGGALVGVCRAADADDIAAALRETLRTEHPDARVIPTRASAGIVPEAHTSRPRHLPDQMNGS
ncbi:galactokinase [Streptomyces qinzhouensis]|uniref:GHMP family kinase ATP-binding protein n=1 Tax=Streptomyces qinzhouensis TaxID=2599401 RepID=UPI001FE9B6B5|nr:galactokinase [Streptomyces qinzhouensis]